MDKTINESFANCKHNGDPFKVNFLFMNETKNKNLVFDRICTVLKEIGMDNPEFQSKIKIQSQHWTNWRNRGVPAKNHIHIAEVLDVTLEWLSTGKGEKYKNKARSIESNTITDDSTIALDNNFESGPENRGFVPVISWVQAGAWCEAIDNFEVGDAERWIPCPVAHSKHTYALRVKGDSMVAPHGSGQSFMEGMLIYVDPEAPLHSGKKVIAKLLDSNEVTFKVYREEAGKKWLIPLNPMYDKIEFISGMHICGVVIFAGFDV